MNNEVRWKQRFQNFEKSFNLFQRRIDELEKNQESEAYQMALIQSFEILFELSKHTIKDYLENQGLDVGTLPKNIIREAFKAEVITDAEVWMEAVDIRNKTTHTYHEKLLKEVVDFIQESFYSKVRDFYFSLKKES